MRDLKSQIISQVARESLFDLLTEFDFFIKYCKYSIVYVVNNFTDDKKLNFNVLLPHEEISSLYVYRFIVVTLIGNVFDDPFFNRNQNFG